MEENVAETKEQFQAWLKTPEAEEVRRQLKKENEKNGIIIPGKI